MEQKSNHSHVVQQNSNKFAHAQVPSSEIWYVAVLHMEIKFESSSPNKIVVLEQGICKTLKKK